MTIRRTLAALALGLCGALAAVPALAQQTTRIVVPFAAGGGTDQYVRLLAAELGKHGLQVIVENKPGASGIVAADHVARSRPDGLTVLMSSMSILATNTVLYDKLPYDPIKDFASVSQIAYQPAILVGRPDLPYKNIKEMVAYAKANPGKINRGSPGASILTNLAPLAFEQQVGIRTMHIPFNGDTPGLQALLGGQIDVHGTSITGPLPHIKAGKMIVLGVMDSKRLPQVPDAPTFKEQGYDIEALLAYALSVPAATPRDVVERLNRAVNQVIADPEFVARARAMGMEPRGGTPEELNRFMKTESERWIPLLQSLNLPKQGQ
ncbi:tripartite tricarboxylate transporter substrate binding protein [Pseudorhodoferax sp. Leaf265]|jgi:tripartite-type tricarboxylate transporter receptor subunit TctC|uniref:Bug family tripartite tricarboxylate transporter substrate binding protein n=1 Tax=Pseudorhodoferax sp. Leaf265 TaxID=1736315 RepID=UPI0006F86F1E|nr:tripartite tricarboxylate transporter substrate binding protein [Pseudorhodoferax sp. Leaf265]KQP04443.1 MFS transporter [Pseudorhodoferax sp. Leaf265]PZP96384.1 MAG: tripartite tricarboxylate transporter substrate binding protein [Variovorax paradoxus]PZQ07499.1 MAG: tripartite tricarboxylate transporter substrate binding protein [Variovorax paradoxus]